MLTHDSITNKTSLHLLLVPQVPPVCFSSLSAYQRNEKVRRQIVGYKFAGKKNMSPPFSLIFMGGG